jgi:DNA-binding CsgD family transcriptional regulator
MISDTRLTPTRREIQVLKLVAHGLSNKEIALQLEITEFTVKNHLLNMFERLGFYNRVNAVVTALKKGWIALSEIEEKTLGRVSNFGGDFPGSTIKQIERLTGLGESSDGRGCQKSRASNSVCQSIAAPGQPQVS